MTAVIIIVVIIGNLFLFSGTLFTDLSDNGIAWFCVIAAVVFDVWFIYKVVSAFANAPKDNSKKQRSLQAKEAAHERERQKAINNLQNQIKEKENTLSAVSSFAMRFKRIDSFLDLVSIVGESNNIEVNNNLLSYKTTQFEKALPALLSSLPDSEKKRVPTSYSGFVDYQKDIREEKDVLLDRIRQVQKATTKREIKKMERKGH